MNLRLKDWDSLSRDPSVDRWLRFREVRTKEEYTWVLNHFILDLAGPSLGLKEPSAFVARAKSRLDNIEVQDVIEKFGEAQPDTTRLVRMSIVRSFLKRNGIVLPSMGNQRQVKKDLHRAYTREEVQTVLSFLDDKTQKLYVLIAKDSGLRAQDILAIQYRHLKDDLEAEMEFVHLAFEPKFYNRRKASGITFIGPNTVKLLKQLIEEGKIQTKPDAPIFSFRYPTIAESLLIAKNKARLDPKIQTSHGFRKFFENSLDRVGMDHHLKLRLEGHSAGTRDTYTSREVEELRTLYEKAYQFLDLSEEAAADNRVKALEKTVSEQSTHIESLKAELAKKDILSGLLQELGPDGVRTLVQIVKEHRSASLGGNGGKSERRTIVKSQGQGSES